MATLTGTVSTSQIGNVQCKTWRLEQFSQSSPILLLTFRGLNINLVLLADEEDEDKDSDTFKELGMSAKFDLVVHVARKVQNTLGQLADNLEKLKKYVC